MTAYRCRRCQTVLDGMGIVCTGCGNGIRIPVRFANGHQRYLPRGMTFEDFEDWIQERTDEADSI